jgi:hypothetical protein
VYEEHSCALLLRLRLHRLQALLGKFRLHHKKQCVKLYYKSVETCSIFRGPSWPLRSLHRIMCMQATSAIARGAVLAREK